jgi:hypothetical protein
MRRRTGGLFFNAERPYVVGSVLCCDRQENMGDA